MPNFWWVNQGNTYDVQRPGGYVFASSGSGSGRDMPAWDRLKQFQVDDVVFHYARGALRALGKVTTSAELTPHPEGERQGAEVNADQGYKVSVQYYDIEPPIALDDIPLEIRDRGPFTKGEKKIGDPNQQYANELSNSFVMEFRKAFLDRLPFDPW